VDRHRRNLPHWQQPGACYFVTFRLGDALPQHLLDQWREERKVWLRWNPEPWSDQQRNDYHERFTEQQQEWLDAGSGACHLRRPEVRQWVRSSVMKFDAIRYDVDAFVLMPNHVHLLWQMRVNFDLTKELKALKGASARACNVLLGLEGTFWMEESYDRIVRDRDELAAFRRYIADNPTKARLNANEFTLEIYDRLEVVR
jgi:REP element-mobilizing transposase RayT